jgi:hypothetical protein
MADDMLTQQQQQGRQQQGQEEFRDFGGILFSDPKCPREKEGKRESLLCALEIACNAAHGKSCQKEGT